MTCSLVVVFERAATACEIVVYFCVLPTVRAPGGAFVRLVAKARETRLRQSVRTLILVVRELISRIKVGVGRMDGRFETLLYFD